MSMHGERRAKTRYPIELTLSYQTLDVNAPVSGVGRSMDMSSSGLLVSCPNQIPEGTILKITIDWPTLLNGATPLQLVTIGKVARSDAATFAVALESYEFRTTRRRSEPLDSPVFRGSALPSLSGRQAAAGTAWRRAV